MWRKQVDYRESGIASWRVFDNMCPEKCVIYLEQCFWCVLRFSWYWSSLVTIAVYCLCLYVSVDNHSQQREWNCPYLEFETDVIMWIFFFIIFWMTCLLTYLLSRIFIVAMRWYQVVCRFVIVFEQSEWKPSCVNRIIGVKEYNGVLLGKGMAFGEKILY